MDGGAWRAAVHGVAKSRTRLKQLSTAQHRGVWWRWHPTHKEFMAWAGTPPEEKLVIVTRIWRMLLECRCCSGKSITTTLELPLPCFTWVYVLHVDKYVIRFELVFCMKCEVWIKGFVCFCFAYRHSVILTPSVLGHISVHSINF